MRLWIEVYRKNWVPSGMNGKYTASNEEAIPPLEPRRRDLTGAFRHIDGWKEAFSYYHDVL